MINATAPKGVAAGKPLVELSSNQQNSAQVVVGGTTPTLVSDINAGDQIARSPINGVGMKATTPAEVIGTAQASLNSVMTVRKTTIAKSGKPVTINVGLVPISVNVTYYAGLPAQNSIAAYVPRFLQSFANKLAGGRNVSPLRVLISTSCSFLAS